MSLPTVFNLRHYTDVMTSVLHERQEQLVSEFAAQHWPRFEQNMREAVATLGTRAMAGDDLYTTFEALDELMALYDRVEGLGLHIVKSA